jgi:hypothetical protein
MYKLFESIKARKEPPTFDEQQLAANAISIDSPIAQKILSEVKAKDGSVAVLFHKQIQKEVQCLFVRVYPMLIYFQQETEFDVKTWENLLVRWIAACDQPFEDVEKPEFKALLKYTRGASHQLQIPSATTVKRRIMDLGKQMEEELKTLIRVSGCFFYRDLLWSKAI